MSEPSFFVSPVWPAQSSRQGELAQAGLRTALLCTCDITSSQDSSHQPSLLDQSDLDAIFLQSCADGEIDKLRDMLRKGASVDARDDRGRNAAMIACLKGHREVLTVLMSIGFDMNAIDGAGRDINHYLSAFGTESDLNLARSAALHSYFRIKSIHEANRERR